MPKHAGITREWCTSPLKTFDRSVGAVQMLIHNAKVDVGPRRHRVQSQLLKRRPGGLSGLGRIVQSAHFGQRMHGGQPGAASFFLEIRRDG